MKAPVLTIVGASGWFGRTLIHEYLRTFGPENAHRLRLFGSRDSTVRLEVDDRESLLSIRALSRISGDGVADSDAVFWYAAILHNRIDDVGLPGYRELNDQIADRVLGAIAPHSDVPVVFASSGVAREVSARPAFEVDPYTHLKLDYEDRLVSRSRLSVLYPYAMTGSYMQQPHKFALGSFVQQIREAGRIVITAPGPVMRSYGSVHDLSRFLLSVLGTGDELPRTVVPVSVTLDLVQLAVEVAAALGVTAEIEVADLAGPPSLYTACGSDYAAQLSSQSIRPTSLADQIRLTGSGPAFDVGRRAPR